MHHDRRIISLQSDCKNFNLSEISPKSLKMPRHPPRFIRDDPEQPITRWWLKRVNNRLNSDCIVNYLSVNDVHQPVFLVTRHDTILILYVVSQFLFNPVASQLIIKNQVSFPLTAIRTHIHTRARWFTFHFCFFWVHCVLFEERFCISCVKYFVSWNYSCNH